MIIRILVVLFSSLILVSCNTSNGDIMLSSELSAEDYLLANENADIIQINGSIYQNIDDTNYEGNEFSLGNLEGEIQKQTKISEEFEDWTATELPVGTKIFNIADDNSESGVKIFLVVLNEKVIPYIYRIEG